MKLSQLTQRIQGETVDAWELHQRAYADLNQGKDVLLLSIGDPDFATPDSINETAITALRNGDTHYVEVSGRDALRDAIADDHQCRCGQVTSRENVMVMAGAQNALFTTSLCLAQAGDEVIVLQPMYVTYEACVQITGAKLVPVSLDSNNGFRLDVAKLEAAITSRTCAIYFATPNNPTGVMLRLDELEAIAQLAIEHDLWVVSDEVYCDIVYDGEHHSIAALPNMAERTVTINSLSKSHAMTGWRIGWAIAPQCLIPHLSNVALCMLYGLPGFIQQAGLYALTKGKHEAKEMRDTFQRRRDLLVSAIDNIELLDYVVPEAAMYLLVDVRKTGLSGKDFADALYDKTGVATLDATAFGECARGFIRISFTLSEVQLADAANRIIQFMRAFDGQNQAVLTGTDA